MTLRLFLLSLITLHIANVRCGYLEIELVNELFENYNKNTRPVRSPNVRPSHEHHQCVSEET